MSILDFFRRPAETKIRLSDMVLIETSTRAYLKRLALNVCINYLARSFSVSEFQIKDGKTHVKDTLYHKLNVRPNADSSASDFWQRFIYKLIMDNEVLVIKSDTDDLLIADNFQRTEYAVYEDTFNNVVVKDYEFKRTYSMSEVLYVTYNNERLESFVDDLYKDYGKLFGQMMDNSMRRHQLRGFFKFKDGGAMDKESVKRQKAIIENITKMFEDSSVAYAPISENMEVQDLTQSNAGTDESVSDLVKLKRDLIDDVAKMLGIPTNLIHGDVADLENTMDAFIEFCILPLNKKISDELNAKFVTKKDYLKGKHIKVVGLNRKDPLKFAVQADKLVASSLFTVNQIKEMFDFEQEDNPLLDKYYITKNYEEADTLKGGENE